MLKEQQTFRRDCNVEDSSGATAPLAITFYTPLKNPGGDDYLARANISCRFFEMNVYGTGEDAAQAFFALPWIIVSYLIGRRRFGYESFWLKKGDLDDGGFWGQPLA